jgi:hypothetical protein
MSEEKELKEMNDDLWREVLELQVKVRELQEFATSMSTSEIRETSF